MASDTLACYVADFIAAHQPLFYIERLFRTVDEWDRMSPFDLRSVPLSSRTETALEDILGKQATVILGEPGSGKSTVAAVAAIRSNGRHRVPVLARLRSYRGDLRELLLESTLPELAHGPVVHGEAVSRQLVLDGLDEVPSEHWAAFLSDYRTLLAEDPSVHVVLTSRQAFYAAHLSDFKFAQDVYHILGFSDRDIREYVGHENGDYAAFMAEVQRVGVSYEITNPFALGALHRMFSQVGRLGALRGDAVEHVVEALIASRPAVASDAQRRSLRMLAVAMETACRNELTRDEAVTLLCSASRLTVAEAEARLKELEQSILARTPHGYAFQMRSYGEYLAARELSDRSLDKIRSLVDYEGTTIPNESWRNCVGYLAELNTSVRRTFSKRHPDWMLSASSEAFSEDERTLVLTGVLDRLRLEREYLAQSQTVSLNAACRFVTPAVRARLESDISQADPAVAGNALALLGALRVGTVVPLAFQVAIDRTRPELLRKSAILAVARAGDSSMIQPLLAQLDPSDPMHLTLVDCIGALTDVSSMAQVLPLLIATDALVSSAFYRFRQLNTPAAASTFLQILTLKPDLVQHLRFRSCAEPMWEAVADHWDPAWATQLAGLILAWEKLGVHGGDLDDFEDVLHRLPDRGEGIARVVVAALAGTSGRLLHLGRLLASMVSPELARWLAQQPGATDLKQMVATYGNSDVRTILAPHTQGLVAAQDADAEQARARQAQQEARERRLVAEKQEAVRAAPQLGRVLTRLSELSTKDWPELDAQRRKWLADQVLRWLRQIDPITNVQWKNDNQLSFNPAIRPLAKVAAGYSLELSDDVPLVQSLLAAEHEDVALFYRVRGFTRAGVQEFERVLGDPATPNGAVYHFLGVLSSTDLTSDGVVSGLLAIAGDVTRPGTTRSWALRLADPKGATDEQLVHLRKQLADDLADTVDRLLIARQHKATIGRRLAALKKDPGQLASGEVDWIQDSPLSWIGEIRTPLFWSQLGELRAETLRLALPHTATLLTEALKRLDAKATAALVLEQLPLAPVPWQDVQRARAAEYERQARIEQAQATSFQKVIQRLRRATSLGLFKVWCEGTTDGPTIEAFLSLIPGASDGDIVTDSLGGWKKVLSPNWTTDRLADGCHDLFVLLDGDKGRQWNQDGHPLTAEAQRVRGLLADSGIEMVVLERYGIENYFSVKACVDVLGPDVAGLFPLLPHAPSGLEHDKNLNPKIAQRMELADLAGTDLLEILEKVVTRSTI